MSILERFKSLPRNIKSLLSFGLIIGLTVALPLFVWSIVNLNFNQNKRASSEIDVIIPINWITPHVSITADDFNIISKGQLHTGRPEEVTIIPGVLFNNTTSIDIQTNSAEKTIKLNITFRSNGSTWWIDKIKLFDSDYSNEWITYSDPLIYTVLGHSFYQNGETNFALNDPNTGQKIIDVHFTNLRIQGFTNSTPPPTACVPYPLTLKATPDIANGSLNQTIKYDLSITHNDPNCLGKVKAKLIAHAPSGWPVVFTNDHFAIAPNSTYLTSFYVTPTSGQGPMSVTIDAQTIYPENFAKTSVIYNVATPTVTSSATSTASPTASSSPSPSPTASPTATATATATATSTSAPIVGDVNQDGAVNVVDLGIIVDHYGESASSFPTADVNGDGTINVVDIQIVIDNY